MGGKIKNKIKHQRGISRNCDKSLAKKEVLTKT